VSHESGKPQVYVQLFPETSGRGRKVKISQDGGGQPTWRSRQGAVLLFPEWKTDGCRCSVHGVHSRHPELQQVSHAIGCTTDIDSFNRDATADGKRFLIKAAATPVSDPVTLVLNWTTG
jgi:hypothetical protein